MNTTGAILMGIIAIAVGLLIIIYGVRIARIYAILSALGLAIAIGFGLVTLLLTVLRLAINMIIPILIALAIAGLLLYWVAKGYMLYLKIYAVLGMIKIGLSVILVCLMLLHLEGGIAALIILAAIIGVAFLIVQAFRKWGHLMYMIGIMTDGALLAVSGGVMVGSGFGMIGVTILLAGLAVPLLIWAGLYRECWRQKIAFPGIKSW